jgi:phosphoadenosine phosphosulfate reductase
MAHFELPPHPLVAQGYHSIGCVPCTVKGGSNDNPRAGRWAGQSKEECGIYWTVNGQPVRLAKAS